jgi:hypothetical protein
MVAGVIVPATLCCSVFTMSRNYHVSGDKDTWVCKFLIGNYLQAQVTFPSEISAEMAGVSWIQENILPEPLLCDKCPTCGKEY